MSSVKEPRIKPPPKLPDEHILVGRRHGAGVAEHPKRRRAGVQANGQPAKTALVTRVQSYLRLERC